MAYDLRISRPLGASGRFSGFQDNETGKIIELDIELDGDFGGCIISAIAAKDPVRNLAGVGEVVIYGALQSTGWVPVARAYVTDASSWRLVAMLSGLPFTKYRFEGYVAQGTVQIGVQPLGASSSTGIFVDKSSQQPPPGWVTPGGEPTGEFANLTTPARWDDPGASGSTSSKVVRTVPGVVLQFKGANNGPSSRWFQAFDAAALPPNNTIPFESFPVPSTAVFADVLELARVLRVGLVWAISSTSDVLTLDNTAKFWVNTEHAV